MAKDYDNSLGRIAYDAYSDDLENENAQGQPLPSWNDLSPRRQDAWSAAAEAVANQLPPF